MSNKMKINITIVDENGSEAKPITVDVDIPSYEDFKSNSFEQAFDSYETAVLRARKEATEQATKVYLEEMSKKKVMKKTKKSKEK